MVTSEVWQTFTRWIQYRHNPVARELAALERDKATGIALVLGRLNRALREADEAAIQRYHKEIADYLTVVGGSDAVVEEVGKYLLVPSAAPLAEQTKPLLSAPKPDATPAYWVSSTVLAEAYAYLTQHLPDANSEPEWMLAVSGLRQGKERYTLEKLIEVPMSLQTPGNAAFNMQAFARIAITLSEHGQALHAIFHSHRIRGPQNPSGTDWRLQEKLDQAGYPAIQAVFSEDAYVRFFANKPFVVEVHGTGVENVNTDKHLYRITNFDTLPNPRRLDD